MRLGKATQTATRTPTTPTITSALSIVVDVAAVRVFFESWQQAIIGECNAMQSRDHFGSCAALGVGVAVA